MAQKTIDLYIKTIARSKCEKTAKAYYYSLKKLLKYLEENEKSLFEMGAEDFSSFLEHLETLEYSQNTQALAMNSLHGLWEWLRKQGRVTLPSDLIPIPATEKKEATFITPEEYNFLISKLNDEGKDLRDKTIISLYFRTGMRASELTALTTMDIDLMRMSAKVWTLKQRRSQDSHREANFTEETSLFLNKWLIERQKILASYNVVTSALFVSMDRAKRGSKLSVRSIQRMIKSRCQEAGISKVITPKSLRHGFVTEAIKRNMTLSYVAKQVGHKTTATTARYEHGRNDDVRRSYHIAFCSG